MFSDRVHCIINLRLRSLLTIIIPVYFITTGDNAPGLKALYSLGLWGVFFGNRLVNWLFPHCCYSVKIPQTSEKWGSRQVLIPLHKILMQMQKFHLVRWPC